MASFYCSGNRDFRWLCALGLTIVAGCGTKPASAPPVKLTVFGLSLETGEQLRQDAIDEFTRKTGVEVELIPTPGSSTEQLSLILNLLRQHATSPDVYVIDSIWPGTLHEHLEDLTPYLHGEAPEHLPVLLANDTVNGRLVCLPLYMNGGMLYYRADLLARYGYTAPPATWQQLARMAAVIQQGERRRGSRGFWGYVWQGAAYEGLTCNALEWQGSYGGGRIVEEDGTVSVNNPRAAAALTSAAGWVRTISPASVLEYTETDSLNVFRSGNAAFMRHWSSAYRSIVRHMKTGTAGVARVPAGPAGRVQTMGGFQLGISRYSGHKREAAELVLYLTGKTVQSRRALERGISPTYPDLFARTDMIASLPQLGILRKATPGSWILRPSTVTGTGYAEVSKAYYEGVHRVLSHKATARATLAELGESLKRLTRVPASLPGH